MKFSTAATILFISSYTIRLYYYFTLGPGLFQPDSYYYYNLLKIYFPIWIIITLPLIILFLVLTVELILLKILGKDVEKALLGGLLFTFIPTIYNFTYAGYVDTPVTILLIISLSTLITIKLEGWFWKGITITSLYFLLSQYWHFKAATFLFIIYITTYLLQYKKLWKITVPICTITTIIIGYIYSDLIIEFYSVRQYISELQIITTPSYYILLIITITSLIYYVRLKQPINYFLVLNSLIFTIMAIPMRRFAYISTFFLILLLIQTIQSKTTIRIITFFLVLTSLIQIHNTFSTLKPNTTIEDQQMFATIPQNTTILTHWGEGHIIQAFTKAEVPYKAHPNKEWIKQWPQYNLFNTTYLILTIKQYNRNIPDNTTWQILNKTKNYILLFRFGPNNKSN